MEIEVTGMTRPATETIIQVSPGLDYEANYTLSLKYDSCLTYGSRLNGHGFTRTYPVVVGFHGIQNSPGRVTQWVFSNLCSNPAKSTCLEYVTLLKS